METPLTHKQSNTIILLTCQSLGIDKEALSGKSRIPSLVTARALVSRLLRDRGEKLYVIGLYIKKSHCDVIHLLKRHKEFMEDLEYRLIYEQLSKRQLDQIIIEKIEYHEQQLIELRKLQENHE